MLLAAVGAKDDPASGGRMMPSHWSKPSLHIVNGSSATGTQCLQAAGCGEASKRLPLLGAPPPPVNDDEVTYVSLGDGATGEGEFWEFLNTICTERLPVVCLVEDNGYAISCPADYHTAGGDISRLVESFPHLEVIRVDGTDLGPSYRAMREAVAYARARKGPALVHAKVIRPYSHSHTDDERLYKSAEERELEATRDPIARLAAPLILRISGGRRGSRQHPQGVPMPRLPIRGPRPEGCLDRQWKPRRCGSARLMSAHIGGLVRRQLPRENRDDGDAHQSNPARRDGP